MERGAARSPDVAAFAFKMQYAKRIRNRKSKGKGGRPGDRSRGSLARNRARLLYRENGPEPFAGRVDQIFMPRGALPGHAHYEPFAATIVDSRATSRCRCPLIISLYQRNFIVITVSLCAPRYCSPRALYEFRILPWEHVRLFLINDSAIYGLPIILRYVERCLRVSRESSSVRWKNAELLSTSLRKLPAAELIMSRARARVRTGCPLGHRTSTFCRRRDKHRRGLKLTIGRTELLTIKPVPGLLLPARPPMVTTYRGFVDLLLSPAFPLRSLARRTASC